MRALDRLYKRSNYTIQKTISIEDKPYTKIKELVDIEYDATISDLINVCIEEMVERGNVKYSSKPEGEIAIYRSIMVRRENVEALTKINKETGISLTRLINIALKEFLEDFEKTK